MDTIRVFAAREVKPSSLEWVVVVFGVIVQQGAFIPVPLIMSGDSLRAIVNPFNTIAVSLSLVSLSFFLVPQIRKIASVARQNIPSLLFITAVLLSARWSLYPDVTMRRGIGYLLTVALAAYLAVRFGEGDRLKALSASFAISAVGSIVFIGWFPQYGVMQDGGLGGAWRGVFPHKNVLGPIMAIAVFVELYILVKGSGRPRWRFATLTMFASLVALSHSTTAWLLAFLYSAGAGIYLLWRSNRMIALATGANCLLAIVVGTLGIWRNPALILTALGKDPTLTGRTRLWDVVLEFIREKPLLGWGYHAMWIADDPTTILADRLTGQWGVTGSHNAFLEITLQLGAVGLGVMLIIIAAALWRGIRCCQVGTSRLGWFSLIFVVGALLSATTVETLGQNQVVEWLVFNVFLFSCGIELRSVVPRHVTNADPATWHQRTKSLLQSSTPLRI